MQANATSVAVSPRLASKLRSPAAAMPVARAAHADPRWPAVTAALAALREQRRRAVRIVDADCGCGTLLIEAVRHARALGFTAIEGRGIDGSPAMIGRARAAAARAPDPAIGLEFEMTDMLAALESENDLPADIVLWHGGRAGDDRPGVAAALRQAGDRVIGDCPIPSFRELRA